MLDWLRTPLAIVFVFGLVVFIHELGHFLAAKATGVYAPRFSIGFGPALWSHKWGETEYVIAAIPLGGYVRMASREDETMAMLEGGGEHASSSGADEGGAALPRSSRYYDPDGMAPFGPRPVPEQRLFESKSLAARLLIMFAGVTMNMVLGFVILGGLALQEGVPVINTRVIGGVMPVPGAPQLAQLAPGDTILAVNGQPIASWDDFVAKAAASHASTFRVRTQRGQVTVPLGDSTGVTLAQIMTAVQPDVPAVIAQVFPDGAGARAGMQQGDSIVGVNGRPMDSWPQVVALVQQSAGDTLHVQVARGGSRTMLAVRPDSETAPNPVTGRMEVTGRIGVERQIGETQPISLGEAIGAGWSGTWVFAGTVVGVVKGLFTGGVSVKALGGPITIARVSAQAAEMGFATVLRLLAFLSVNVAVLNLLPIPILDGGQILLNVAEAVKGRAFSTRTRENILRFGLVAIGLLFALVMYNDITSLVKSLLRP
ncbi:MAG TPA: RIP metalloprotease RseP [Gemmatimonadaceae bacterium]|nr:RIP metalloprotease RseP [Gemmatimonadaceae bacterium]